MPGLPVINVKDLPREKSDGADVATTRRVLEGADSRGALRYNTYWSSID